MKRGTVHDLEDLLRALAIAGAAALLAAVGIEVLGTTTRALAPVYGTTLRFLVAVLIVTAPYAELVERRRQRRRALSTAERLGFGMLPGRTSTPAA